MRGCKGASASMRTAEERERQGITQRRCAIGITTQCLGQNQANSICVYLSCISTITFIIEQKKIKIKISNCKRCGCQSKASENFYILKQWRVVHVLMCACFLHDKISYRSSDEGESERASEKKKYKPNALYTKHISTLSRYSVGSVVHIQYLTSNNNGR